MEEQYTTNVIEIKPDKKYLFVLECPYELNVEQYERIKTNFKVSLKKFGFDDPNAIILESLKLKVLEMDKEEDSKPFSTVPSFKGIGD